ncbi:hypothetical protein BDN70DRAFT_871143 [Pholiota conissans]|uniref:Uncharacterized protein n=1 Tax=Pholiota conissans TaxID=109636 RepID=A0A9P5ZF25_9AGAR|nr:hypothetical protein BDN70DRAFT_871143 [Pholiota conissans]
MKHTADPKFKKLSKDSSISQFLSDHDHDHRTGFITRLDRSPVSTKRWLFVMAIGLNVAILLTIIGIVWISFIREFVCMGPTTWSSKLVIWAMQNLIILAAIAVLLRSTTIPFFFGECRLRLLHGFRPSEILIRKSPSVRRQTHSTEEQRMGHYWRTAIRAIDPNHLYSAASAILSSEYWTIEYDAVLDALDRVSAGQIDEHDFEFSIWKQNSENIWSVYKLWMMHEIMSNQHEMAMFRGFLTQSGKTELLKFWEEMAAPSKDTKGIISSEAYQSMVQQFAREGLDYETLWSQVSDRTSV